MRAPSGTWLCPDEAARARVRENSPRVRRARMLALLSGVPALADASAHDVWVIGAGFAGLAILALSLDRRMARSRRPEFQSAATLVLAQVLIALGGALTGGPRSPMLALIVLPTAFAATRFRPRVAVAAAALATAMLLLVTLAPHPAHTLAHPSNLLTALILLAGITAVTQALFGAELEHRETAILDPLTGLLNRQGLERRFEELAEQARLSGAPIALIVCDVDHFKAVNDHHGHATGDAVLREVAGALRAELRSFELIYRLGGEEFLVVLPGAGIEDAAALGERLRAAVQRTPAHRLALTVSVGVATHGGGELTFAALFEAADQALYAAKRSGRNRVVCAPSRAPGDPHATLAAAVA